jgi:hypothetical protein
MQFAMAFKIIGVLLILFSSTMLPSLLLSVVSQDGICDRLWRHAGGRRTAVAAKPPSSSGSEYP